MDESVVIMQMEKYRVVKCDPKNVAVQRLTKQKAKKDHPEFNPPIVAGEFFDGWVDVGYATNVVTVFSVIRDDIFVNGKESAETHDLIWQCENAVAELRQQIEGLKESLRAVNLLGKAEPELETKRQGRRRRSKHRNSN